VAVVHHQQPIQVQLVVQAVVVMQDTQPQVVQVQQDRVMQVVQQ
tara:strand:- start:251 stop:382 length:132 start_codon:yes stop_codon:yes gene_type:complete